MVMSDDLRLPGGGYDVASLRCTRTAVETLHREYATRGCRLRTRLNEFRTANTPLYPARRTSFLQ